MGITGNGGFDMDRFTNWLRRVMYGRYGQDEFSVFLLAAGIVASVVSLFPHMKIFYYVSFILIALSLYRCLSKNHYQRQRERQKYLQLSAGPRKFLRIQFKRFQERKTHVYYRCPKCGTYNRIPRGHGRILITCPKCRNQFQRGKKK